MRGPARAQPPVAVGQGEAQGQERAVVVVVLHGPEDGGLDVDPPEGLPAPDLHPEDVRLAFGQEERLDLARPPGFQKADGDLDRERDQEGQEERPQLTRPGTELHDGVVDQGKPEEDAQAQKGGHQGNMIHGGGDHRDAEKGQERQIDRSAAQAAVAQGAAQDDPDGNHFQQDFAGHAHGKVEVSVEARHHRELDRAVEDEGGEDDERPAQAEDGQEERRREHQRGHGRSGRKQAAGRTGHGHRRNPDPRRDRRRRCFRSGFQHVTAPCAVVSAPTDPRAAARRSAAATRGRAGTGLRMPSAGRPRSGIPRRAPGRGSRRR